MPDFRFEGSNATGRSVKGIVTAESFSEAKKKVHQLSKKHSIKVAKIMKRRTFMYKAQKPNEEPIKGEQKAFTKEEVAQALETLGYKILSIQPKVLDFQFKPPPSELITFVRVSADMLREKLSFTEILSLLINDTQNPTLRDALKEINNDLRQGKDSEEAFMKQEKALGRFTARMLGLASKSGSMAEIYESTAKFLERNEEFRRNLRSALITPFFTLLALLGAVVFYVAYIFPETAMLFVKLGTELPPMTAATLELSQFLSANVWMLTFTTLGTLGGIGYFFSTPAGQFLKDRYMIKMPIIGGLIHKTAIEIFCRVFYSLYSGSGENIDALKLAAEACGNKYMEQQIKTISIPMMLSQGRGLYQAFEASNVFTKTALARFHSGAETGTVKSTSLQIANYYEKETVYKLKNAVEMIQLLIAMIISVVITALTIISSETALVSPQTPF